MSIKVMMFTRWARRGGLIVLLLLLTATVMANEQGTPFCKVLKSEDYGANSLNYDILCDNYGTVYVANLEGLLYYDGCTWRKLYTPGISRISKLAKSDDGRIWFGGFNVIGYLTADARGNMHVKTLVSDLNSKGTLMVTQITQQNGKIIFHTNKKKNYSFDCKSRLTFSHRCGLVEWSIVRGGLQCRAYPSPYSHITKDNGLTGEVLAINELNGILYVGTREGLFTVKGGNVKRISGIDLTCWSIVRYKDQLLAATSGGLFVISRQGIRQHNKDYVLSVCVDSLTGDYITGEEDGIYRNYRNGGFKKINDMPKASYVSFDGHKLVSHSIYEEVPHKIDYKDRYGRRWISDDDGNHLKATGNGVDLLNKWIYPLSQMAADVFFLSADNIAIVGNDNGITSFDANIVGKKKMPKATQLYIREIVVMNDSVLWGGYNQKDMKPITEIGNIDLPSSCRNIIVRFSLREISLISPIRYRYRINGGTWSSWSTDAFVSFNDMRYGRTKLEIQAIDQYGQLSAISTVKWKIEFPFYESGWAILAYVLILVGLVSLFFRWRTRRLKNEKIKLEEVVTQRTSELRKTLTDLKNTQDALLQMERTATAGKLTRGLIDRILNPINYINNFSALTRDLTKDIREDIDNWDEDSEEDCRDVLDLMDKNLSKIIAHGKNTTRTLRAMETILDNHVATLVPGDIVALCSQAVTVGKKYHSDIIDNCHIQVITDLPSQPVMVDMDPEAINKVICSLLANSIYAVGKKFKEKGNSGKTEGDTTNLPKVTVKITVDDEVVLTVHDNGTGMEDSIKEKVFDPFFTTKPTSDADGVGLYLVRQIIEEHKAKISVSSVMDQYCEFTMRFPKTQNT